MQNHEFSKHLMREHNTIYSNTNKGLVTAPKFGLKNG